MTRLIYVPRMNNIHISGRNAKRVGRGMGSVLLQTGGTGSASSYESVEDYKDTTGRGLGLGLGLGVSSRSGLNKKLESLSINPSKQKPKNIKFSF